MIRQNAPPKFGGATVQVSTGQQEPSEVPEVSRHLSPAATQADDVVVVAAAVVQELVTLKQINVPLTELSYA